MSDSKDLSVALGELLATSELFCESFTEHADRCRQCTVNWQSNRKAIAKVRAELNRLEQLPQYDGDK